MGISYSEVEKVRSQLLSMGVPEDKIACNFFPGNRYNPDNGVLQQHIQKLSFQDRIWHI